MGKKTNGKPGSSQRNGNGHGHKNGNGHSHKNGNGHGRGEDIMTVTFRIPAWLKRKVEAAADQRGTTTTRVVVDALTNEVTDKPPRWWRNRNQSRPRAEGRAS